MQHQMHQMQHQPPLFVETSMITTEKLRGLVAGSVANAAALGMNALGVTVLGLSAPVSMALMLYIFGGVLGYVIDILFAKREFGGIRVSYTDLWIRSGWLVRSFGRRVFLRFVVSIVIETLTAVAMLDALILATDHYNILNASPRQRSVRNLGLAGVIGLIVYILFGSVLRYDWAYNEAEQPAMNMAVMVWVGVALMVFATGTGFQSPPQPRNTPGSSSSSSSSSLDGAAATAEEAADNERLSPATAAILAEMSDGPPPPPVSFSRDF